MSVLQNEIILENLFEEVLEEFPNNTQDENEKIARQRFTSILLCPLLSQFQ